MTEGRKSDQMSEIPKITVIEDRGDPNRITPQPEYDALNAFDADNNVEPFRTIAERIAWKYGASTNHPLVDDISSAIEDAHDLGVKRGPLIPKPTYLLEHIDDTKDRFKLHYPKEPRR